MEEACDKSVVREDWFSFSLLFSFPWLWLN